MPFNPVEPRADRLEMLGAERQRQGRRVPAGEDPLQIRVLSAGFSLLSA
jgi:hypothetical protein